MIKLFLQVSFFFSNVVQAVRCSWEGKKEVVVGGLRTAKKLLAQWLFVGRYLSQFLVSDCIFKRVDDMHSSGYSGRAIEEELQPQLVAKNNRRRCAAVSGSSSCGRPQWLATVDKRHANDIPELDTHSSFSRLSQATDVQQQHNLRESEPAVVDAQD